MPEEKKSQYAKVCSICGEAFEKAGHKYYDHYKRHFPERCHKCDYCSRLFTSVKDFQLHVKSHTGEKPYKCELCDFRCASKFLVKVCI